MTAETPSFTFNGNKIPIKIGYKEAMTTFPDLGLDLLSLFKDEMVIRQIMTDDAVMIKIWYHYVSPFTESLESAIENHTPEAMNAFREAFWQQTVNFSPPHTRALANHLWTEIKTSLESPEKISEISSSDL